MHVLLMAAKLLRISGKNNTSMLCLKQGKIAAVEFCSYSPWTIRTINTCGVSACSSCHFNVITNFMNNMYYNIFHIPVRLKPSTSQVSQLSTFQEKFNRSAMEKEFVTKRLKDQVVNEIENYLSMLSQKESYCDSDWENLKDMLLKAGTAINVNKNNVETLVMKYIAQFNHSKIATSYLLYVRKHKKVNVVTLSLYLKLMYNRWSDHTPEDVNNVEKICDEMLKLPLLEYGVAESLILGLCLTKNWKESVKVVEKMKDFYDVSPLSYSAIITAAFQNNETEVGLKLLDEKVSSGWLPEQSVYDCWFAAWQDKKEALDTLMKILSKSNEALLTRYAKSIVKQIRDFQNKNKETDKHLATISEVTDKGVCRVCKNSLERAVLSANEFEKLKSSFLDSVIVGRDVFQKTNPKELKRFQEYLQETGPYDFVLDGLNIAYSIGLKNNTTDMFANMLKHVVSHFAEKKKKVLVLGRNHMLKWPKGPMQFVKNNAHLFLIDDVSQDDPYLLYAALLSGMNCNILSRDMMRGHKYLFSMQNRELNSLFWRWQCTHQYVLIYILKNGDLILKEPVMHLQRAHYVKEENKEGRWHVPCKPEVDNPNVPGHKKFNFKLWLCLPDSL